MSDAFRLAKLDFDVVPGLPPGTAPRVVLTIEMEARLQIVAHCESAADRDALATWIKSRPRIEALLRLAYAVADLEELRPEGEKP